MRSKALFLVCALLALALACTDEPSPVDPGGDSPADEAPSAAPRNVTVRAGDGRNTVSWDPVSGAAGYNLYWTSDGSAPGRPSPAMAGVTSPYVHTGLANDVSYRYAVCAYNASGEGPLSVALASRPLAVADTVSIAGDFALDLYHATSSGSEDYACSPYCVSAALAMAFAGARNETEAQMASALDYPLPQENLHADMEALRTAFSQRDHVESTNSETVLRTANSAWIHEAQSLLAGYVTLVQTSYAALTEYLDFAGDAEGSRGTINTWVSNQTEGLITELIPQGVIDAATRLILVNTVYFHGSWLYPFPDDETGPGPFTLPNGSTVSVDMMHMDGQESLGYARVGACTVVELPYVGNEISMALLVPDLGTFETFRSSLDGDRLQSLLAAVSAEEVVFSMPRFSVAWGAESLKAALRGMGMTDAFDAGLADFSGMTGDRSLFIQDVLHKAVVEVDEYGTEAAAATAVVVGVTSVPPPPIYVTVDRPFLFVIRDNPTGTILFLGHVVDP